MVAALLPLPENPMKEMRERDSSTSNLSQGPNDYTRQLGPMDEARYESAKWWRNLNRWMSLVGVLIIVAVVSGPWYYESSGLMRCRLFWLFWAFENGGDPPHVPLNHHIASR
jgi:hypothetical protein